jgi:pantoate--beta-alanine ligase
MTRQPLMTTTPPEVMDATLGAVTVGLVPVMGRLHEGHLALIRRSDLENDDTVVAIFDPNGTTPALGEDDIRTAHGEGARIFYCPDPETIFPEGFATHILVDGLDDRWEGEFRPGRAGRTTAYFAILLNQLQPTRVYVGEKHLQRVALLRRMQRDLSLPGEIVPCPTVRDPDGLPLSSYNLRLSPDDRAAALAIPDALFAIQQRVIEGETDPAALLATGREIIAAQPGVELQYLAIVDPETFDPVDRVVTDSRAIVAATVGDVRIIDNVHLDPGGMGNGAA